MCTGPWNTYLWRLAHSDGSRSQVDNAVLEFAFLLGFCDGEVHERLEEVEQVALPQWSQAEETIEEAAHILFITVCNLPHPHRRPIHL